MTTKKNQARNAFLRGETKELRVGGYAGTVIIKAVDGMLWMKATKPARTQKTIGPDVLELRKRAVEAADMIIASVGGRKVKPAPVVLPARRGQPSMLTNREIWEEYIRSLIGTVPEGILGWGRLRLAEFYEGLTPTARQAMVSFDSLNVILQAARRLHRDGMAPLDGDFSKKEAADWSAYLMRAVVEGSSPSTVNTYFGRYRTAVRHMKRQKRKKWGRRTDHTKNVKKPMNVVGVEIPPEKARPLLDRMAEMDWRAWGAGEIAYASGRRIGAIGARRAGKQLDVVPLCASDFSRESDGTYEVVWRGEAAKGRGFGEGDVTQVCTRRMAVMYRYLRRYHPNPLGPDAPLIWDANNPAKGAKYDALSRVFNAAWLAEFGEKKPKGVSWHSFCHTTITDIADVLGLEAAAEHTGRSVAVVAKSYKKRRKASQARTAARLDDLRSGRR